MLIIKFLVVVGALFLVVAACGGMFYLIFPGVVSLLLVIWGLRSIIESTYPAAPRLKSYHLLLGLVAAGLGGTILFGLVYGFVGPASPRPFYDRVTNMSDRFNH